MRQKEEKIVRYGIFAILSYFIIKCLYIALTIEPGILPDETAHLALIKAYHQFGGVIIDPELLGPTPAGSISQDRFLFHLIVARGTAFFGFNDWIIWIRIFNILLSILNIYCTYRIIKIITGKPLVILFAIFCFSNILMFTAMSCAVSYDSLVNLIATVVIWQLFVFCKNGTLINLANATAAMSIGLLTKPSILPFVLIFALAILIVLHQRGLKRIQIDLTSGTTILSMIQLGFSVIFVIFFLSVSTRNFLKYDKALNLKCQHIFGSEVCYEKNGLMRFYMDLADQNKGKPRLSVVEYYDSWIDLMIRRLFGIAAAKSMGLSVLEYSIIKLTMLLFLLSWPLLLRSFDTRLLFSIFLLYMFSVFIFANYIPYLWHGNPSNTIHGRYLFPVQSCFAILLALGLTDFSTITGTGKMIPLSIICVFAYLDFPSYLTDPNVDLFARKKNNTMNVEASKKSVGGNAKFFIDYINNKPVYNASILHLTEDSNIVILGWAYDTLNQIPLKSIAAQIEQQRFPVLNGLQRIDVKKATGKNELEWCGFKITIPIENQADTTRIKLIGYFSDKKRYENEREIVILHHSN